MQGLAVWLVLIWQMCFPLFMSVEVLRETKEYICWVSHISDSVEVLAEKVLFFCFIRGLTCPRSVQTSLTQTWISLQPPFCFLW